jgi:hypothetical protein
MRSRHQTRRSRARRGDTFAFRRIVTDAVHRLHRAVRATLLVAVASSALAAAPCGQLLSGFLDRLDGTVAPCLVDLQENGLCFELPGTGLDMAVRSLDGQLQAAGVPRPFWEAGPVAEATRFVGPSGDRLEIVLAATGPFDTVGSCRIVPER